MAEELNGSLEYTPTWIVAVICSIIVFISLCVERALHRLGKYLAHKNQVALYQALQKLKEELMLLGFISLLLTVSQGVVSHICIPSNLVTHMLPCKRHNTKGSEHDQIYYNTIINRRRLLSEDTNSKYCIQKGKVPLLTLESLHHLHVFIFVLAIVHAVFFVTTMILGGTKIRRWKKWEDDIRANISRSKDAIETQAYHHQEFVHTHAKGYWRKAAVVGWMRAFFKQFYGSVTKSDYIALRQGFIKEHCPHKPDFDFHKYMMRTLEIDFKKVVGISWYLWLFVVVFLLLNVAGWHTYFWLAFLPLILLLLVGAKLEYIIDRLAQELVRKSEEEDQEAAQVVGAKMRRKGQDAARVKPSDEYFWFNSPALVLDLIHFILFQNSFEIAFFFWILCTYGFDSCIMEKISFIIPRLIMGVIVQVLCSYSTLPLYTIVTQMGSKFKKGMFDSMVESSLLIWAERGRGNDASSARTFSHRMVKEPTQHVHFDEQAITMMEGTSQSTLELPCIVQTSSEGT